MKLLHLPRLSRSLGGRWTWRVQREGLPATEQTTDCLHPAQQWLLAIVRPPNLPRRPLLLGGDCCSVEEGHCLAPTVSSVDVTWKRLTHCVSGAPSVDLPSATSARTRPKWVTQQTFTRKNAKQNQSASRA